MHFCTRLVGVREKMLSYIKYVQTNQEYEVCIRHRTDKVEQYTDLGLLAESGNVY